MKLALYSAKGFERDAFDRANQGRHEILYHEARLDASTAPLADGCPAICAFANDDVGAETLDALAATGVRLVALRCAGFNQVNLDRADELGIAVARVPAYSPHAVAEHAAALLLSLVRKIHRAHNRVREHNFSLDGLIGFDLHGKTVGVIGAGKIGASFIRIMRGFGCTVLAHDPSPTDPVERFGAEPAGLDRVLAESDVISLHCPLTPATHHLIDAAALDATKPGVVIVNTSRGGVVDTRALIESLKQGRLGGLALDVYEEEGDVFFRDLSEHALQDDILARLLTFPNVLVTAHQGFLTREAIGEIASVTLGNLDGFERDGQAGIPRQNVVSAAQHVAD